ncbi:hypothetical protein KIH41_17330 [Litoribacter ruber]|nr:hypothetical protein [Litoribacter ruber]MBT0813054.1 hypothetical protein [Litoribacter ruber]
MGNTNIEGEKEWRPKTGDGRRETEDGRRETEDGRRETEDGRPGSRWLVV